MHGFDRQRALARSRQRQLERQYLRHVLFEPEPPQTGEREHDRVERTLRIAIRRPLLDPAADDRPASRAREPGLHVPADRHNHQIRPHLQQLDRPPQRAGSDPRPARQPIEAAGKRRHQRIARVVTERKRSQNKAFRQRGRHVLGAVHGDVRPPVEERLLQLLDEETLPADLRERSIEDPIAFGRHRHQRALKTAPLEQPFDALGLPERQRALARGDPDHPFLVSGKTAEAGSGSGSGSGAGAGSGAGSGTGIGTG